MKKIFKNILMQSFVVLSLCFTACQEYGIDSQPESPLSIKIDAMDEYTVLATSPSNVVFNISSNTPWTIETDQQWCKPTPSMSASSSLVSEIVVKCESNETVKQREAILTIKAEGIEETKSIKLIQVSKENLVVIPYDGIVSAEGGDVSFNIVSNKPWTIIPSTQFLENIDKTSGAGSETGEKEKITITVPKNPGALRKGLITVKTGFEEYTFEITQNGVIIEPEEPLEDGTISFISGEKEKTLKIRSNVAWEVEIPKEYQEWLSAEKTPENELRVSVKNNNKLVARNAKLILTSEDIIPGFEGVELNVVQQHDFWFADGIEIDESTGYAKVACKGQNMINSNYKLKKGRVIFDFEELNILEGSMLFFNLYSDEANFKFEFQTPESKFGIGGAFEWSSAQTVSLSQEDINNIKP